MSRWTTPLSWAAARPAATWAAMPSACGSGSGPRSILRLSDSPSQKAIAMNSRPSSVSSVSKTVQMLGCSRREAVRASRAKRRLKSSLLLRCGDRNLTAA